METELLEIQKNMLSSITRRALGSLSSVLGRTTIRKGVKSPSTTRNTDQGCDTRKNLFCYICDFFFSLRKHQSTKVKLINIVPLYLFLPPPPFYSEFDAGRALYSKKFEPKNKIVNQNQEILSCKKSQLIYIFIEFNFIF